VVDAETQRRNLEAVQTMAANGILGNWDVVRPFVADDIVLRVPETLPWGGERHGWDGYQQALTIMTGFFADIAVSGVRCATARSATSPPSSSTPRRWSILSA
jgi:hypothetical protein